MDGGKTQPRGTCVAGIQTGGRLRACVPGRDMDIFVAAFQKHPKSIEVLPEDLRRLVREAALKAETPPGPKA